MRRYSSEEFAVMTKQLAEEMDKELEVVDDAAGALARRSKDAYTVTRTVPQKKAREHTVPGAALHAARAYMDQMYKPKPRHDPDA